MNETEITTLLVGIVCFLLILYVLRRRAAARREMEDLVETGQDTVSYETDRDEAQWRRAYSRM